MALNGSSGTEERQQVKVVRLRSLMSKARAAMKALDRHGRKVLLLARARFSIMEMDLSNHGSYLPFHEAFAHLSISMLVIGKPASRSANV